MVHGFLLLRFERMSVRANLRFGPLVVTLFAAPMVDLYIRLGVDISPTRRIESHSDGRNPHGVTESLTKKLAFLWIVPTKAHALPRNDRASQSSGVLVFKDRQV